MIRLECTRGGSNKYYELVMNKSNGRVTVTGYYGAIGQAPKEHPIYDGDNEEEALKQLKKKQLEKEKKGYIVVVNDDSSTTAETPSQKKRMMSQ